MKKKLFLCVLASLTFISVMGQSQTFPIDLQVEKAMHSYSYRFITMEQDADNLSSINKLLYINKINS